MKYEKPLCLLFTFILTFSFNFLQMSLITKELIEHENKFNRKVFLYHESSEKRFSQFVIFCKKPQKVYHEVVSHNKTIVKYLFHEMHGMM